MYQGTNKIALASKKQISDTFLALLKQQAFADISISLICREAGVSRQTFYSLYQSKENIILEIFKDHNIFNFESVKKGQDLDIHFFATKFSFYLKGNTAFLKLLDSHQILYLIYETLYEELNGEAGLFADLDAIEKDYHINFMAAAFMGITSAYIRNNGRQSQAELSQKIIDLFQGKVI